MLGIARRLPHVTPTWRTILIRNQWSGGHQVARRLLNRKHEEQLDAKLKRVQHVLESLRSNSHFKQLLRRDKISKEEFRHALRALLSNPVGLEEAFKALPAHMSAGEAAKSPEIRAAVLDILRVYRMPAYKELDVDLSEPHTWFPHARAMDREIHLHIGPTNSGKTHMALRALQEAQTGWYAGPLRLLAWEVYDALTHNKKGHECGPVACNLLTGQEMENVPGATHTASTVEMVDVLEPVQCAVIDEIQMIGCSQRGWAWTRAVLGMPAQELHLCGDPSATELIRRMCELTGDRLHIHEYTRLSPLYVQPTPVTSLAKSLAPGDCVVAFSKSQLFKLKQDIERQTPHTCAVVYGSLPPETRRSQAELFNAGKHDVLVATDAIGMGLNLQIGRVILSTMRKYDGTILRDLSVAETKQIVGRAGRFGGMFPVGHGAVLNGRDLKLLQEQMCQDVPLLPRAGLMPPYELVRAVSNEQPDLSLSDMLARFESAPSQDTLLYFMCDVTVPKEIAKVLQAIPNEALDIRDRWAFCMAPVQTDNRDHMLALKDYAVGYTYEQRCRLPRWQHLAVAKAQVPTSPEELAVLESVYGLLDIYQWLGNKFGSDVFVDLKDISGLRARCCALIEEGLLHVTTKDRRRARHSTTFRDPYAVTDAQTALQGVIMKLEAARLARAKQDAVDAAQMPSASRQFF